MILWASGRPAVMWSLAAGLIIAGAVAFTKLPLATKTTVELPRLSVSGGWPGAAPELVETYITSPLESAVQGVRGVKKISSTSREGSAQLQIELDPGADVAMTRLAILERLETLRPEMPPAARNSIRVSNYVPEDLRESPLMLVNVTGPYTPGALAELAEDRVVPYLAALEGVAGEPTVSGGAVNGVVITYDPTRLRQLGIDPAVFQAALSTARIVQSLGTDQSGATERSVVVRDAPQVLTDLERLPIAGPGGKTFLLGQLASVRPEEDARGNFYRLNGRTAVSFSIMRAAGADAIKTAARAREAITLAQRSLPDGVQLSIESDDSVDLRDQLSDLLLRGCIAFAAVGLALLLTLRSVWSAGLVLGSALVAISGTSLGLYLLKIPANLLTLAGLAMGIGILVQNGLVVVNRLKGVTDTATARAEASRRIAPAVLGSTLTTTVVLFPFLFLQGNARAAFTPFAAAFGMALFWSVVTALVLVPAVGQGAAPRGAWNRMMRFYHATVRGVLRWRYATMFATVAVIAFLFWGFINKVPRSNWGGWWGNRQERVTASVSFPKGSDPAEVERILRELERVAVGREGVSLVQAQGSMMGGNLTVEFTTEASTGPMPWTIYDELTQRAVLIGGTQSVSVQPPEGQGFYGGSGGSGSVSRRIKLLGYSFEGVRQLALDLQRRLEQIPRVREVNINAAGSWWGREKQVSIAITPDRQALGRVGATAQDFAASVSRGLAGVSGGTTLEFGDEEYPVNLRALGSRDRQLRDLENSDVSNSTKAPVQISDVSTVSEIEELGTIQREDQQYLRIVGYDFRGPQKLADRTHKAFMSAISVPAGYQVGDEKFEFDQDDSSKGLILVGVIGVILVLLAVALVFDSVWAALMVFVSLPMALGGVVVAFWVTGTAFTREAAVGLILVIGLAVHQAILLIDGVLIHKRRHGGPATGADVLRASRDRAGMIMLVTLTTLASLIPMAWGTATDSLFGAIALATAGGTVAGTVAALWLLPPVLIGALRFKRRRRRGGPGRIGRLINRFRRRAIVPETA